MFVKRTGSNIGSWDRGGWRDVSCNLCVKRHHNLRMVPLYGPNISFGTHLPLKGLSWRYSSISCNRMAVLTSSRHTFFALCDCMCVRALSVNESGYSTVENSIQTECVLGYCMHTFSSSSSSSLSLSYSLSQSTSTRSRIPSSQSFPHFISAYTWLLLFSYLWRCR